MVGPINDWRSEIKAYFFYSFGSCNSGWQMVRGCQFIVPYILVQSHFGDLLELFVKEKKNKIR